MGKFLSEITGRANRKRKESELQKRINELKDLTGNSVSTIRQLQERLLGESQGREKKLELDRQARQLGLTELIGRQKGEAGTARQALINQLRSGVEGAFGQYQTGAQGEEDQLRQAILGSLGATRTGLEDVLGRKETGIQDALNKYLSGEFAQELPEIESQLGSRGLSIRGGTAAEALSQQLAKLGGVKFGALSDLARERAGSMEENLLREAGVRQGLEGELFGTGRQDLMNLLQQRLGVGQQEAGFTRQDFLQGQQTDLENYLRQFGIAREDEQMEQQFLQSQRGQQVPLEQQLQQMYLNSYNPGIQLSQQQLQGAQQMEQGFLSGLAQLVSLPVGGWLKNRFPSAQDQYLRSLIPQSPGIAGKTLEEQYPGAKIRKTGSISELDRFLGRVPF